MKTEKLTTLKYYEDKVSLAMQNDPIFMQQVQDFVSLLQNCDNEINNFVDAMYFLLYDVITNESLEQIPPYEYTDLLDKIASIFNLQRHFIIDFIDPLTNVIDQEAADAFNYFNANVADGYLTTTMNLSNAQLRLLIYCAIMKNSYDGSYEMLNDVYRIVCKFMSTEIESASAWSILQRTQYFFDVNTNTYVSNNANVDCILNFGNYEFTQDNMNTTSQYFTLFYAGLLTIHSIGIHYHITATDMTSILYWAAEPPAGVSEQNLWTDTSDPDGVRKWL